jgi:adenosine deaminase
MREAGRAEVTMYCCVDQKDRQEHIHEVIFDVCGGQRADHIDHGLDANSRQELIDGFNAGGLGLTLCSRAYYRRQATEVLFPKIRKLWDKSVTLCMNDDDPTDLYDVWIDGVTRKDCIYCGMEKKHTLQLAINGAEMCWTEEE